MFDFVTLGDHISIQKGKAPLATGYSGPGAKPYLNPEYLRGRANAELAKPGLDAVHVRDGDTILLWDGSNAGEFFKAKSGLAASTMAKITPDELFKPAYFFHVTKHAEPYLKGQTNGTGIPHVDRELLEAIRVFCPVPAEQLRLAEILDTLDTAIHETEAIIAKLKAIKQGLLHDLLTRGIDANGELRPPQAEASHLYKESPLGWIPKDWELHKVSGLTRVTVGHVGPIEAHFCDFDSGVPLISTTSIGSDGCLRGEHRHVSFEFDRTHVNSHLSAGDLVVARHGKSGTAAVVPFSIESAQSLNVVIVRSSPLFVSSYLVAVLNHPATRSRLLGDQAGSVQPIVGTRALASLEVALPSLHEQQATWGRLEAYTQSINGEVQLAAKLHEARKGLMDDLFTGRVRVTPLLAEAAQQPGSA